MMIHIYIVFLFTLIKYLLIISVVRSQHGRAGQHCRQQPAEHMRKKDGWWLTAQRSSDIQRVHQRPEPCRGVEVLDPDLKTIINNNH